MFCLLCQHGMDIKERPFEFILITKFIPHQRASRINSSTAQGSYKFLKFLSDDLKVLIFNTFETFFDHFGKNARKLFLQHRNVFAKQMQMFYLFLLLCFNFYSSQGLLKFYDNHTGLQNIT